MRKNKFLKPIVLVAVFLLSLVLFSIITNKENEDLMINLPEPTLPVMYLYYNDIKVNELHGYTDEMDMTMVRDNITPITSERELPIQISTFGAAIDGVTYEIRSLDGERLVANGELSDYSISNDTLSSTISIQNLLQEEEEYMMVFFVESGEDTIYFYTRIMQTTTSNIEECIDFALYFHEQTFLEEGEYFIPTYMDAATGDATTLNYVDLSCTLGQIMWADFKGQRLMEPSVSVKEMNSSYNIVMLEYKLSAVNEEGEVEYYNVSEYYRLRLGETRMYVLNYERTMNQIFRGENDFTDDLQSIQLGIRDTNVEYASSETGDTICFVQEGELWCYNLNNNELACVFSFSDSGVRDVRKNWNEHDIKIVTIDEAGSVEFIVYGYMNRGEHEGKVGVSVYHYDGIAHTIEEEVFIPVKTSYEVLKSQLGQLVYKNDQETLYILLEGTLFAIDLETLEVEHMFEGLNAGSYAVSKSGRYFSWLENGEEDTTSVLKLMDLKDGSIHEVTDEDGTYLRPLGFIEEDFVYGVAKQKDIKMDAAGNTIFAMSSIKILNTQDDSFEVVKNYVPNRNLVSGIWIDNYTIYIQLIEMVNGQYVLSGADTIMNREADTGRNINIKTTKTDIKQTQVQIALKNKMSNSTVKRITPQSIIQEEAKLVDLEQNDGKLWMYVYAKGEVQYATNNISDAIYRANQTMGVVVDNSQNYVWMRAHKTTQSAFAGIKPNESDKNGTPIVKCVSAMLQYNGYSVNVEDLVRKGTTPKQVIENTMQEYTVLELNNCTAEEIIFYVSEQSPVFAMVGVNDAILIIGYNTSGIYYYDPHSSTTKYMTYEEADQTFQNAGNIFFSYLK